MLLQSLGLQTDPRSLNWVWGSSGCYPPTAAALSLTHSFSPLKSALFVVRLGRGGPAPLSLCPVQAGQRYLWEKVGQCKSCSAVPEPLPLPSLKPEPGSSVGACPRVNSPSAGPAPGWFLSLISWRPRRVLSTQLWWVFGASLSHESGPAAGQVGV